MGNSQSGDGQHTRPSRSRSEPDLSHLDADDPMASMSYWQMAKMGYQELVNAIIRPPRANYEMQHLGPAEFMFCDREFVRIDYDLINERGMKICCSHWQPIDRAARQLPCVIYMHGNSSARLEAIPQLALVLSLGVTLLSFDFAGSGMSGGDYVTLGYFEKEDLKVVIDHLRESGSVSTVALWGRSMGAATSLLHGHRDPSIAAMILDSPFADLTQLAGEMVDKGREAGLTVPNFVVSLAITMIKNSVKKTAGFDIRELSPIRHVGNTFIPALFVAGEQDDFIQPHHARQLFERYSGDKNLILVEGDHNSPRPKFLHDSVGIFLQNYLQIPLSFMLDCNTAYMGMPPWYISSTSRTTPNVQVNPTRPAGSQKNRSATPNIPRQGASKMKASEPDIGMDKDRTLEIQQALYQMLGNEKSQGGSGATNGGFDKRSRMASHTGVTQSQTRARAVENIPSSAMKSKNSPASPPTAVKAHAQAPTPVAPQSGGEWACAVCTLNNAAGVETCDGCGLPRASTRNMSIPVEDDDFSEQLRQPTHTSAQGPI